MSQLPKVRINGVDLATVNTQVDVATYGSPYIRLGYPLVSLREAKDGLVLTSNPLTVAQLYFDGVLPQDRTQPIKVKIGRGKTLEYRLATQRIWQDRHMREQLVLRFERV